jgi:trk system potassium uptake protein TrkH
MKFSVIIYFSGGLLLILSASMVLPISVALSLEETAAFEGLFLGMIVAGFFGGVLVMAFRGEPISADRRNALCLLVLAWIMLPGFAALPFWGAGVTSSPVAAYFEAVSGLTTTGATILPRLADVPQSLILWRAQLQWMGGLMTLIGSAVVLAPLFGTDAPEGGKGLSAPAAQGSRRLAIEALSGIFPLYAMLSLACLVLLLFAGMPPFDALCFTFSTLSTGGFMPRDGSLALYGLPMAEIVIGLFMFIGAVSIFWVRALTSGQWHIVRLTREPFYIGGGILVGTLVLTTMLWLQFPAAGQSWLAYVSTSFVTAASLLSTTGFRTDDPALTLVPLIIIVSVCFIGGGRFSTAGGIKVMRLVVMLRESVRHLDQLLHPSSVRQTGNIAEAGTYFVISTVWTIFFLSVLNIAVTSMALAASGIPFVGALVAAMSAIGNAGPIYEIVRVDLLDADVPGYHAMSPAGQIILCLAMITGRIELLAILALARLLLRRD